MSEPDVPVLDRFSLAGKVADHRAAVQAAVGRFGHLDVLVNNAGLGTAVPSLRETPEQFREVIDVNLMGACWSSLVSPARRI